MAIEQTGDASPEDDQARRRGDRRQSVLTVVHDRRKGDRRETPGVSALIKTLFRRPGSGT